MDAEQSTAVGGKTETAQTLPKVGALCAHWVRCGTHGCRCADEDLHGPYCARFWREGERLRKRYVRLADVLAIENEIEAQHAIRQGTRETLDAGWVKWHQLAAQVLEVERHEP
jgi:hypothetical protein